MIVVLKIIGIWTLISVPAGILIGKWFGRNL